MTTREVVDKIIVPETAGSGVGYALLRNHQQPLRATLFVSHSWDERYTNLTSALTSCGEPGPFWVCATALYQPEDLQARAPQRPSRDEVGGLLTGVIQQAAAVLCVLSTECNVYERLWCIFEMSMAVRLGVEVRTIRKSAGFGWGGVVDEALITACNEAVDAKAARCGPLGSEENDDERALHAAIAASPGGHEAVNRAVEEARLAALLQGRDRLLGGGWKETGIGRNYVDAIDQVCLRLGRVVPKPSERFKDGALTPPGANGTPPQAGPRGSLGGVVQPSPPLSLLRGLPTITPRSATRRHWTPLTSV